MSSVQDPPISVSNTPVNLATSSEESAQNSRRLSQEVPAPASPARTGGNEGERSNTQIRVTATIRTQQQPQAQQPTNNNNGELPQQTQNLFLMRDRLFLALFFRVSLIYARTVPKTLRRVIEFCLLLQSLMLLCTLA